MKIILSRKGFDSASGGCANPIMEDGRLLPLPIPDSDSPIRYGDIAGPVKLGKLVADLTRGRLSDGDGAHLDPDLDRGHLARDPSWRPLFGQCGAASGHLAGHGVGPGDLFLFFAWFRPVCLRRGRFTFVPKTPDRHIFYGWFQIDQAVTLAHGRAPAWMRYHPHCHGTRGTGNTLFVAREQLSLPVAREQLSLPKRASHLPGAGLFSHVRPPLILTRPEASRSHWQLPSWFHPEGRASHLSYHGDSRRWQRRDDNVWLRSAYRGQEFVLDSQHYPEALNWASALIDGVW